MIYYYLDHQVQFICNVHATCFGVEPGKQDARRDTEKIIGLCDMCEAEGKHDHPQTVWRTQLFGGLRDSGPCMVNGEHVMVRVYTEFEHAERGQS
jgi:hypothetical protein